MKLRVLTAAVAVICVSGFAYGQAPNPRPGASTPVQVLNTTANPVPVTVDGGISVSGSVTVSNTAQNPVPVSGVVISGEVTELLHSSFVTVDNPLSANNPSIGPIDVSGYKTVRVVLRRGSYSCGPCAAVPAPTAYVQAAGNRTIDKLVINEPDLDIGAFASRSYDVPGTQLTIRFTGDNYTSSYTVNVSIYGRAN